MWVVRKAVIIHALKICPDVARSKLRTGDLSLPGRHWLGWKYELAGGEERGRESWIRMDPQVDLSFLNVCMQKHLSLYLV